MIVVLRPPATAYSVAHAEARSDQRLALTLQEVTRDLAITNQFHKHLAKWVEDEQIHTVQEEPAAYLKSGIFHEHLLTSLTIFKLAYEDIAVRGGG